MESVLSLVLFFLLLAFIVGCGIIVLSVFTFHYITER
jgi:hypothetical protein